MISKSPEVYFSKPSKSTFMPSSMTRLRHSAAKSVQDHNRRGEKEEHFEGVREVHITDGIDMGYLHNERKGVVDENLFKVPTVDSGEVFDTSTFFTIRSA